MKTKLVTLCLLLFAVSVNAQYFQNTNGTTAFDRLYDGTNVVAGGQGHLMVGATSLNVTNQDLIVTRTDIDGLILGVNSFNSIYQLKRAPTPYNDTLTVIPTKILQLPSGNIAVVGHYLTTYPFQQGIFVLQLNPAGTVLGIKAWTIPSAGSAYTFITTSACLSSFNTNRVFICGYTDAINNNLSKTWPFVLSVNCTAAIPVLSWGSMYDFPGMATGSRTVPTDL
ncbi:MAG: hypothetical protein ACRC3B_14975, partial [Bacteroidia bacterium]